MRAKGVGGGEIFFGASFIAFVYQGENFVRKCLVFRCRQYESQDRVHAFPGCREMRICKRLRMRVAKSDKLVENGERFRGIQIIIHRLPKALFEILEFLNGVFLTVGRDLSVSKTRYLLFAGEEKMFPIDNFFEIASCLVERVPGEVHLRTIVSGKKREAQMHGGVAFFFNIFEAIKIAFRFGHFFPVDKEVSRVHPKANARMFVRRAFRLRNLRFMMRKYMVFASGVDVELFPQVRLAHGAAFDMPARVPATPRGIPLH